jgi:hypothetical protein
MQNINDIILNITGVSLDSTTASELSLTKNEEPENGVFLAQSRASVINMVCNTVGSLDNLVSFALLNNLSLTEVNKKPKKILFLFNKISDYSVLNNISAKRLNFITELSLVATQSGGFLLQENAKYILQENSFKVKL